MSVTILPSSAQLSPRSTSNHPPRKVIVGTIVKSFYGTYPGLESRLKQLAGIIDTVAIQSNRKYGRNVDIVVLPETVITKGEPVAFDGQIKRTFAQKARQYHCYIVVPMLLLENKDKNISSNAAILVDREGNEAGIYRKVHLIPNLNDGSLEYGATPGKDVPVFDCDFGKLGIQICFDMQFDYGWDELARKGADIVVCPTQSPATACHVARAMKNQYYIVTSNWRNNATIFEPTGVATAQIVPPEQILVQEVDLSYAIILWNRNLRNGMLLKDKYGDKVGFHYYEREDLGIFWSNDSNLTIRDMILSVGLIEQDEQLDVSRKIYHNAGIQIY